MYFIRNASSAALEFIRSSHDVRCSRIMEANMAIAVLLVAVFALLVGMRLSALVGRDGTVHYAVPGARRVSVYRKLRERKLGMHG